MRKAICLALAALAIAATLTGCADTVTSSRYGSGTREGGYGSYQNSGKGNVSTSRNGTVNGVNRAIDSAANTAKKTAKAIGNGVNTAKNAAQNILSGDIAGNGVL